jgi:hypothetical protein
MGHPDMKTWPLLLLAAGLAACAEGPPPQAVTSQASGTTYFRLGAPGVYKVGSGVRLVGQVCRRYRSTDLSPYRVRIEHLSAAGEVIGVTEGGVPPIYDRSEQACVAYSARADWTFAPGDALRACFDRGRPCSPQAAAKTVVPVPKT